MPLHWRRTCARWLRLVHQIPSGQVAATIPLEERSKQDICWWTRNVNKNNILIVIFFSFRSVYHLWSSSVYFSCNPYVWRTRRWNIYAGDMMMIYSVRVYLLPNYEHDVMLVLWLRNRPDGLSFQFQQHLNDDETENIKWYKFLVLRAPLLFPHSFGCGFFLVIIQFTRDTRFGVKWGLYTMSYFPWIVFVKHQTFLIVDFISNPMNSNQSDI